MNVTINAFVVFLRTMPIPRSIRVNSQELDFILKRQFDSKNITPYEFGIYNDGLWRKIKSNNYLEEQQV